MPTATVAPRSIYCDTLLRDLKAEMRQAAFRRREACDPVLAGQQLSDHVLRECLPEAGQVAALFWPMQGEIDIRPLLYALEQRGQKVCLPVTGKRGAPLVFRQWHPDVPLVAGKFGTSHPDGPKLVPDWLLVPLLAFDRDGHRLGYGAGYYDRTLAALPNAFTVGAAFAALEVPEVPTGPDDVALRAIATEVGVITC